MAFLHASHRPRLLKRSTVLPVYYSDAATQEWRKTLILSGKDFNLELQRLHRCNGDASRQQSVGHDLGSYDETIRLATGRFAAIRYCRQGT